MTVAEVLSTIQTVNVRHLLNRRHSMKTNEEIYKMSVDELVRYCATLKRYEVDRKTFKIVESDDIIVSDIKLNIPNGYICLEYCYRCCIGNHSDTITDRLYRIRKTAEKMNYAGIFDNEEDAINAAKQFEKHEKLKILDILEEELSSLMQNVENLKQEIAALK